MDIVFLCTERELTRERLGMCEALAGMATVRVLPAWLESTDAILDWWRAQSPRTGRPVLLWPDPPATYLPEGLARCAATTACWHIDSFSAPEWRAEHARLFDVTFVFHPGSVMRYRELGVPEVHLLPHAVRPQFFADPAVTERPLDIAFVGSLEGAYAHRRACLAALESDGHRLNDYRRSQDYAELVATYRRARIGVNVPRDDHLKDANLRCFEVMAAGALLLTPAGSELRDLGFAPGRHYVEFTTPAELRQLARHWLGAERERAEIAAAGRERVLGGFTYVHAAATMLRALEAGAAGAATRRPAPAAAQRIGLRYFARRGHARAAWRQLQGLARDGQATIDDARDAALGLARAVRARLRGRGRRAP